MKEVCYSQNLYKNNNFCDNHFCDPVFLQKINGVLYFGIMNIRHYFDEESKIINTDEVFPATFNIYGFDGKNVVYGSKQVQNFNMGTYVNGKKSRSWMFENPFRNTHGWA
jgi:hypothetical protein